MENGYTPIANEILEAVAGAHLNGTQLRILLLLWRNSYGFHKKDCFLPLSYLAQKLRGSKSTIGRQMRALEELGVVGSFMEKRDGHTPKRYVFLKDYSMWRCGAGEVKKPTPHLQEGPPSVSKTAQSESADWTTEKYNDTNKKNKYNFKYQKREMKKSRYDYDEIMRKTFENVTKRNKGDDID